MDPADTIGGVKYSIPHRSFFQVNPLQTENLYNRAVSLLSPNKNATLIDLCCGAGTISANAARYAGKVIGVEVIDDAITAAKHNAELNGLENCC